MAWSAPTAQPDGLATSSPVPTNGRETTTVSTPPQDQPLWRPNPARAAATSLVAFQAWAAEHHGAPAAPLAPAADDQQAAQRYADLHAWSTADLDRFWTAVTQWFDVRFTEAPEAVLADPAMPGARWFPGAASTTPSTPFAPPTTRRTPTARRSSTSTRPPSSRPP